MSRIGVGIDLGCSTCCVAVWSNGRAHTVVNPQMSTRTTPSCVAFTRRGEIMIGELALEMQESNQENTLIYPVRWLLEHSNNSHMMIKVEYQNQVHEFSIELILAILFKQMKESAEGFLGQTVNSAFISYPIHFNHSQRQCLMKAANIAGFDETTRIRSVSTAAMFTWAMKHATEICTKLHVLTFSLGAGSCAVSVYDYEDGVLEEWASNGIPLGGLNFDERLFDHCIQEFVNTQQDKRFNLNAQSKGRLKKACEKAKQNLSAASTTAVHVDSLMEGVDFHLNVSRSKFEELNGDLFEQILQLVEDTIQDANLEKQVKIDEIVLVGGSSRIPYLQAKLSDRFLNGKSLCKTINLDEAVALGCASIGFCTKCLPIEKCLNSITASIDGLNSKLYIKNDSVLYGNNKTLALETTQENQKQIIIDFYEGESSFMKNNTFLGFLKIENLPKPKHTKLKVEFRSDLSICGFSIKEVTPQFNLIITPHFRSKMYEEEVEISRQHLAILFERNSQIKKQLEARIEMEENLHSIKSLCESYHEWLHENTNATTSEINSKKEEFKSQLIIN